MGVHDGGLHDGGPGERPKERPTSDPGLGDGAGFRDGYPGRPSSGVAYRPALATKDATSGTRAVVGDLGRGKTMFNPCMMLTNTWAGRQCLMIDPKGGLDPEQKEGR